MFLANVYVRDGFLFETADKRLVGWTYEETTYCQPTAEQHLLSRAASPNHQDTCNFFPLYTLASACIVYIVMSRSQDEFLHYLPVNQRHF